MVVPARPRRSTAGPLASECRDLRLRNQRNTSFSCSYCDERLLHVSVTVLWLANPANRVS